MPLAVRSLGVPPRDLFVYPLSAKIEVLEVNHPPLGSDKIYDRCELVGSRSVWRSSYGAWYDLAQPVLVWNYVHEGHWWRHEYATGKNERDPEEDVAALHNSVHPFTPHCIRPLLLHRRRD